MTSKAASFRHWPTGCAVVEAARIPSLAEKQQSILRSSQLFVHGCAQAIRWRSHSAGASATTVAGRVRSMCCQRTQAETKNTSTVVAAIRAHAAQRRLDGDFISERLQGKQRFLHANVDRGWRERGRCARDRGEGCIRVARDTARRVGYMRDTADHGILSFVFHGVGRRGWISCTLPSEPQRETQAAPNVEQGYAGALGLLFFFFFCAILDRNFKTRSENNFVVQTLTCSLLA